MLEKEMEFIYTKIIGKLRAGYFDDANAEIKNLIVYIPRIYQECLEKHKSDKAKLSKINKNMHKFNRALRRAEHYALRAGRDRNPIVINGMRAEALKYSEEAIALLKQAQVI